MKKKLPNIFANKIEKPIGNNETYAYAFEKESEISKPPKQAVDITKKLNQIFDSPHYVYKMDVSITTKEGTMTKRLIGRNRAYVITMDNEKIPISSILDIQVKE